MSVIIELNFSYCLNFVFNKISNGQLSKRAQILNFQISHVSWIELIYSYCLNFVFNKISNGQLSKRAQILNFQISHASYYRVKFFLLFEFCFQQNIKRPTELQAHKNIKFSNILPNATKQHNYSTQKS